MYRAIVQRLAICGLILLGLCMRVPAAEPSSAAGYWEGSITVGATPLAIQVLLEQDAEGEWSGTIDIPVQGVRNLTLGGVSFQERTVEFTMPELPGNPNFHGRLADDGNTIEGQFTQAGQTFEFKLDRKAERPSRAGETPAKGVPGEGLAGFWQGSLRIGPVQLRLLLKLKQGDDGAVSGTLVSIDQGASDIPITSITQTEREVHIELKGIGSVFEGELNEEGSELAGQWEQGGQSMPLVFKRLEREPDLRRPQEPKPPYPYEIEEVTFENSAGGVTLAGTFTRPKGEGPHPAVVLISGSGPQDRDEAIMGHRPFLVLADHLTREGIGVLRFDDRGVGKSTGDFAEATLDDFVGDAVAAVDWLKGRPDVDASRIGLVGHSEGGIIGPLAAVQRPDDVAFLVLMAGVGVPMEQLLVRQGQDIARVMGQSEEFIAKSAERHQELFRLLANSSEDSDEGEIRQKLREITQELLADLTEEERAALGLSDEISEAQVRIMESPWFRQLVRYDPGPILRQVRCPVLAINGEKDLQVASDENLAGIEQALEAGGNTDVRVVKLPSLNHLFQESSTGSPAEYGQIEETFSPNALQLISDWIREQTR